VSGTNIDGGRGRSDFDQVVDERGEVERNEVSVRGT